MKKLKLSLSIILLILVWSCQDNQNITPISLTENAKPHVPLTNKYHPAFTNARVLDASVYQEDFTRTNTNYILGGTVQLGSNDWWFDDARIYTDRLRIRNLGEAMMYFYYPYGAGTISVSHSKPTASTANSTWRFFIMHEDSSWEYVGPEFSTTSTTFSTASVDVNVEGNIIIGVEKLTSSGDLYFDELTINSYTAPPSCSGANTPGVGTQDNNMTMGNPSDAGAASDNFLLNRTEYSFSFNGTRGIPNWVSWHLSKGWSTNLPRSGSWGQDELLPGILHQASDSDYTGSGFDRGHLCPVDDRDFSLTYMDNTFKFSNAFPQNPRVNQQGPWRKLEEYLKQLSTSSDKEIYIIAGTFGVGGKTNAGTLFNALPADAAIKVPSHCWKVALILPNGTDDICRASLSNAQVVAVYIPNAYSDANWQDFAVTVDQVEFITGYNFFEELPDTIENGLESLTP